VFLSLPPVSDRKDAAKVNIINEYSS
jgi:hypothetical protein